MMRFTTTDRIFHLVADIAKFVDRNIFQAFAAPIEVFVDFDRRLLHHGVSIFASTPEEEVFPSRNSGLVVILVET